MHLSMFCTALVFNGKSSQRRGPEKRPKAFFVCFVERFKKKSSLFYPKRRMGLFAEVFEEHYGKNMEGKGS